jgi:hypothetical protein
MAGYSYPVKRHVGRVYEKLDGIEKVAEGIVLTSHGIVWVCSNTYDRKRQGLTTLHFMHSGRLHVRSFQRKYSAQYLVTLAARFAKEIASC